MPDSYSLSENLVAIEKVTGVELKFLGSLLWYTITDCRVTREQLKQAFTEAGIDICHLPKPKCARDAFRRATKAGQLQNHPLDEGKFLNILIRDVKQDRDTLVRQMVREIVDSNNVRLSYRSVASLYLKKDELEYGTLAELRLEEWEALGRIEREFESEKVNYNGRTVRDIVMSVLRTCSPVAVRQSGGVYFVPEKYTNTVTALKIFIGRLGDYGVTGQRSSLWSIPVVDAEEQRMMLEESLEEQIKKESQALVDEMTKTIKAGRRITPRLAQQYVERSRELSKMVKEYEEMLEMQATAARASLDLAVQEAAALLSNTEED